ncbi:MAG: terminase small subunit [Clostridiales bacterium]|nr:terminase small subunit [Clostridiales bacterium]
MKPDKLSKKEKLFCCYYSRTRSGREAAARAGYQTAEKSAERLLALPRVRREISSLSEQTSCRGEAQAGLRRIAFGNVSDPIRLLLQREEAPDPETLDLFNISEIKQSKTGVMEIKFFDRVKALEKLAQWDSHPAGSESSLQAALEESAQSVKGILEGAQRGPSV